MKKFKTYILRIAIYFNVLFIIFNFGCKKEPSETKPETGLVNDIEGNVYKTVKIGNQWWMAENLKVTKYRNGHSISKISNYDTLKWKSDSIGAYCIYDDNSDAPGLLYNWYAANDTGNIAPPGWHVPTDNDWKEMEKALGMSATDANKTNWRGSHEGEKLKIAAPVGWSAYSNIWGTNESGFSALAGGCRMFNGSWSSPSGIGFMGFWWTSSEGSNNQAWYRYLDYKNANIFRYYGPKTYGFSIRCVKD